MEYKQMTDDNGKDMKFEITQDKLVDLLMHSATRQDIADLRLEMKSDKSELKAEIAELRSQMNSNKDELKSEISKVDDRVSKIEDKISSGFKWMTGILVVGVMVPMFGILITIALKTIH